MKNLRIVLLTVLLTMSANAGLLDTLKNAADKLNEATGHPKSSYDIKTVTRGPIDPNYKDAISALNNLPRGQYTPNNMIAYSRVARTKLDKDFFVFAATLTSNYVNGIISKRSYRLSMMQHENSYRSNSRVSSRTLKRREQIKRNATRSYLAKEVGYFEYKRFIREVDAGKYD